MNFKRYNGRTWETVQHKIYGSGTDSLTAFPAQIQASGEALTDYRISGNTIQDGTPTPQAPVDVVGCGVRTANLSIISSFSRSGSNLFYMEAKIANSIPEGDYTVIFTGTVIVPTVNNVSFNIGVGSSTYVKDLVYSTTNNGNTASVSFRIEQNDAGKSLWIRFPRFYTRQEKIECNVVNIFLFEGIDAKQYKIPITCGGETNNIYLAEPIRKIGDYADTVESDGTVTRRIKKLVLTGEENIADDGGNAPYSVGLLPDAGKYDGANAITWACSHYKAVATSGSGTSYDYYISVATVQTIAGTMTRIRIRDVDCADLNAFKAFLAQQYAAGTPVTIYYVLATPTTESITAPTIQTISGSNIISFGTTVQPSGMSATFRGWHPVQGAKQYDGSEWS